jgi:DNA helicase INO80
MPTLFDSHDEFQEWFSRDVESHAAGGARMDERASASPLLPGMGLASADVRTADQLHRLHTILKPFMLRRLKKDVEHEMADKVRALRAKRASELVAGQVEKEVLCDMTPPQQRMYRSLRARLSVADLVSASRSTAASSSQLDLLLNLVMQFRKVRAASPVGRRGSRVPCPRCATTRG